jgi:hypothetical protein
MKGIAMSSQYITVHVPPTVASPRGSRWAAHAAVWIARAFSSQPDQAATSRRSQWWVHGVNAMDRACPVVAQQATHVMELGADRGGYSAVLATQIYRWAHSALMWLRARSQPRNDEDILAFARSVERAMPNLAAELRCIALRQPGTAE